MAELPAKAERWRRLGYASYRDWRLAMEKQRRDAARAARIDSSLPNGAAPSPAGVASAPAPVVPTRKRRSNHPPSTTGVLCKWFDDHRRDPYPSPKEKGERVGQQRRPRSPAVGEMCAAPLGAHHPTRVVLLMRSCTSLPRGTGFTNQRQRNWLCQRDDGKLLPAKEMTASWFRYDDGKLLLTVLALAPGDV